MKKMYMLAVFTLLSATAFCQKDTLIKKLDSLAHKKDSTGVQVNNTSDTTFNTRTILHFKTYVQLLGSNLKQEFTKPFHMTKRDWGKFATVAVVTGGLFFADESVQKQALRFRERNPGITKAGRYITNLGGLYETYTLVALGSYGFIFKNQKLKTITLLASQAYITGTLTESVVKLISGRTRPNSYAPLTEAEPKFEGPFGARKNYKGEKSNSSFPSGHATVAFAAATVFATEYKYTVWVPILSYSVASLISISRITENKHWASDIFAGAALGFLTGKHVVDNYHRFAKIKSAEPKKHSISFNMQYNYNHMEPAIVYEFR